jgi:two-component system chemotaxis response regulator CheY
MPNMDGLEFLKAMKANPSWHHIPVMMVTTEGSQDKVLQALKLGAAGYVKKPFTPDQIKDKLTGLL